jgi:ATP-dependent Lon protease
VGRKKRLLSFSLAKFELPANLRDDIAEDVDAARVREARALDRKRDKERKRTSACADKAEGLATESGRPPDTAHTTFVRVFDPVDVARLEGSTHGVGDREEMDRIKKAAKQMREVGPWRPAAVLGFAWRDHLRAIDQTFPNFHEATDYVRASLALAERRDPHTKVQFDPLLLSGPPGIGKTLYVEELARILAVPLQRVDMASAQNGSRLAGSDEFWSNSRPGLLFDVLAFGAHGGYANSIVLLDELEKVADARYSPTGALYTLLERRTARRFADLSFPAITLDAGHLIFVGTANNPDCIPDPIRSRMRHVEVAVPSAQALRAIASRIYANVARELMLPCQEASEAILDRLVTSAPREVLRITREAFGRALAAGREVPYAADFELRTKAPVLQREEVFVVAVATVTPGPPVSRQPRVHLTRWRVFESGTEQFLAGFILETGKIRCSSRIATIDPMSRTVRTSSDRLYELIGEPADQEEALALGTIFKATTQLSGTVTDATDGVLAQLAPRVTH